jgi:hypothetical protein
MCSIILNITDVTGQASNGKNFVISSALYTYIEYVIGANMYLVIFYVLSHNILSQSSGCFWKCYRNSRCRCWYNVLPKILGGLLYAYLYPPYAADDVSGELWQFLSAIHDKGDALTFFE